MTSGKLFKREIVEKLHVRFVAGASYACVTETDRGVQCCERSQVVISVMCNCNWDGHRFMTNQLSVCKIYDAEFRRSLY